MLLLAMSGKKQSGKDSAARFIQWNAGVLWPDSETVTLSPAHSYSRANWPIVEIFHVGDAMKEFAAGFGVSRELLWGDDFQKNTLIDITWEQLPHYERLVRKAKIQAGRELYEQETCKSGSSITEWRAIEYSDEYCCGEERAAELVPHGRLTARQFLQQIGEEMFLQMDPLYWVKKFEESVRNSKADVGLVADPRKPEQIAAIKRLGGVVFRMRRDIYAGTDQHISETALDEDVYDWSNFDEDVDNCDMTVAETNREVTRRLMKRNLVAITEADFEKIDFEPCAKVAA
jgi:hypothetical protein